MINKIVKNISIVREQELRNYIREYFTGVEQLTCLLKITTCLFLQTLCYTRNRIKLRKNETKVRHVHLLKSLGKR